MSYVQSVLQPGEEVRYQASIHWITYFHGALWLIAACIVWIIAPESWRGGFTVRVIEIVLGAGGLIFLARAWFEWWITEIAVTNRRVIYKRGLVSRKTAEMHMDKIETVEVDLHPRPPSELRPRHHQRDGRWSGVVRSDGRANHCAVGPAQPHHWRIGRVVARQDQPAS